MRLLFTFARAYPWQTVMMLLALFLAGAAEGVSVSVLLPLVSLAMDHRTGSAPSQTVPPHADGGSGFEDVVISALHAVGIKPTMSFLLAVIVGAIILKSLLILFARKHVGYTVAQITTDLRLDLLRSILAAQWGYYVHQPIGRLANAMSSEPMRASEAYARGVTVIILLVQTCIYTSVALLVSWQATLASLLAGLVILVISHFLVAMSRRAGVRQTRLMSSLSARLTDTLQSVKPLKAMARGNLADTLLASEAKRLNTALQNAVFSKATLNATQEPMFAIVFATGIFIALVYWKMSLATILVLVLLLIKILTTLGQMQKEYQKMVTEESAFWSLQQTIEQAKHATEQVSDGSLVELKSCISLQGVQVAYHDKIVLSDMSLEIPTGALTILVGPSGAGKTTIVDLITGLVRPQAGDVYIDGVALGQIDLHHWRRQIGYVPQDNLLLHDSIFVNVTLGDPELGPEDAENALRAANAWDFITGLPEGIYTLVGERGTRLSGGQRQRIMLARALVHQPSLLILDEATTALDPPTEAAICATLRQLADEMTILVVSHQPAILDVASKVYRIQGGKAELLDDRHESATATTSAVQSPLLDRQ